VVAGIRTPHPIADLEQLMPAAYKQLREITTRLEKHYKDIQDFEFTIEENKLFMLQTRNGKRTGLASVVIATDLVDEGLLTKAEALLKVEPQSLDQLLHPIFDPRSVRRRRWPPRACRPRRAPRTGAVVFTADDAVAWAAQGQAVVLVRMETVPDDIHGMDVAQGILTATGGMTSHAAVVGRQMGKPSVVGCSVLSINAKNKTMTVGDRVIREGEVISIDGSTGEVMFQALATSPSEVLQVVNGTLKAQKSPIYQKFEKLLSWTDDVKRLGIRANADIPKDAKTAFAFGAQGIGLCRTEHMFFASERLPHVVAMILAAAKGEKGMAVLRTLEKKLADANAAQKKVVKAELQAAKKTYGPAITQYQTALKKLMPMQKSDFAGLFREMKGYPVTIRTLDPPLHEFLPKREDLMVQVAARKGSKAELARAEKMLHEIEGLHEFNPMLGHRGCRLGITYPEITRMQARAIFEAALQVARKGIKVRPEIMIPLVGHVEELRRQKAIVLEEAHRVLGKDAAGVEYLIGTMIEVPRGAVTADEIAKEAEFFSFGTNDLTQMGFGLSRDDAGKFLGPYVEMGILEKDPFVSLDVSGVGQLVEIGVKKGRATKPNLKIGICGEHGGDPSSIRFFHDVGLNYVSASPYRIPIARLAAAQAQLEKPNAD
jgi:pyruvate,orthophosphate dikinase